MMKYGQAGEWDNEPDRADFEASGYKCALRRGPSGHWCGYVGIPKDHPWFGKGYSDTVKVPKEIIERKIDIDKIGVINLFCAAGKSDAMADGWVEIVLAIDAHGGLTYARDHEPSGEPDGLWWFGFDCAHSGDMSPAYSRDGVYRNQKYTEDVCRSVAKQLARVADHINAG